MRTLVLIMTFLGLVSSVRADVIVYLKNGHSHPAESVSFVGTQAIVKLWGWGRLAVPRDVIASVAPVTSAAKDPGKEGWRRVPTPRVINGMGISEPAPLPTDPRERMLEQERRAEQRYQDHLPR